MTVVLGTNNIHFYPQMHIYREECNCNVKNIRTEYLNGNGDPLHEFLQLQLLLLSHRDVAELARQGEHPVSYADYLTSINHSWLMD